MSVPFYSRASRGRLPANYGIKAVSNGSNRQTPIFSAASLGCQIGLGSWDKGEKMPVIDFQATQDFSCRDLGLRLFGFLSYILPQAGGRFWAYFCPDCCIFGSQVYENEPNWPGIRLRLERFFDWEVRKDQDLWVFRTNSYLITKWHYSCC